MQPTLSAAEARRYDRATSPVMSIVLAAIIRQGSSGWAHVAGLMWLGSCGWDQWLGSVAGLSGWAHLAGRGCGGADQASA
ncbi:hypothetical protein EDC52_104217 [Biostraticola tofi]|uniref:Uncharacterized protein n=1 Tax=Biostraticola tofi TaxID=466109 RepID=A0A4R3YUT8_9GAMM|nr:hypothetical protein EDC52_104217 [Biostraticola tofi]